MGVQKDPGTRITQKKGKLGRKGASGEKRVFVCGLLGFPRRGDPRAVSFFLEVLGLFFSERLGAAVEKTGERPPEKCNIHL